MRNLQRINYFKTESKQQPGETSYGAIQSNTSGFGGEYLSDPMKKRRLIIVVASAITVIVLIVVILSLVFTPGRPSCRTVENRPNVDLSIKPIASQDGQALVRFAGYLALSIEHPGDFDNTRFLELNLQKVRHSYQADTGRMHIRLDTDCATIDILGKKNYSLERYEFENSLITSKVNFDTCVAPVNMLFALDHYYRCHNRFYYCSTVPGLLIETDAGYGRKIKEIGLQADMLDIEIDGDPVSVDSGHFDKDPKYC